MGVLIGEGVAVMGVVICVVTGVIVGGIEVGLFVKFLINSSCTAFLLSTNGGAAVTGVMAVSVGALVKR